MKYISILLILTLATQSCNSKKEETNTKEVADHDPMSHEHAGDHRTDELMAIHDSIMPKMDDIMVLKTKVNRELKSVDSLLALKKDSQLEKRKTEATSILKNLEKADHEMMNWMHQYKADTLKSMDSTQVAVYLQGQKVKIEAVKQAMHHSIVEASAFTERK